jgi:hypothetical protein
MLDTRWPGVLSLDAMLSRHVPRQCVFLTLVAVLAACGGAEDGAPRQPLIDLAEIFRFSEGRPVTQRIVLGDPRDQPLLGGGWAAPETLDDGSVVRRNAVSVTRVSFDAGHNPGPVRFVLRARVELPPDLGPRQRRVLSTVRIRVNDIFAAAVQMAPEFQEHQVELRGEQLRPGRNEIMLKHNGTIARWSRRPHRGSTYFYESIAFRPLVAPPPGPHVASEGRAALAVPAGAEAPFFFRVPAGAELRLTVEPPAAAAALRITVEGDGRPPTRLALRGAGEQRVPIELAEGTVVRLAAHMPAGGPGASLVNPAVWGRPPLAETEPPAPPSALAAVGEGANLLLYVVDTLRADRLGCYGDAIPTSPAIDGLARDGVLFEHLMAQSSWTRPATASILTGGYPGRHGAITLENAIAPEVSTLAELLRAAGYRTAGFVTNVNVADRFGFGRGFEVYRYLREDVSRAGVYAHAAELHAEALAWLDEHAGERVFTYLHATDPHGPYTPSADSRRRLGTAGDAEPAGERLRGGEVPDSGGRVSAAESAYLSHLYDAEIADLDAAFGEFLGQLARRGLLERTVVVLVADHGEEFQEHGGFGHGRTLYREQLHVPCIMRLP